MRRTSIIAALALAVSASAQAQSSSAITNGEQLLTAMYGRYATSWYHTLTFVQKSTYLKPDGTELRSETWYEALSMPAKLRIDRGDPKDGNGSLYSGDSVYTFNAGKQTRASAQRNALLILGFDVYTQPVARSVDVLKQEGFDLAKFHRDSWQGQSVYVVGALAGDTLSKQFWVDTDNLLFVRLLQPNAQRTVVQDIRFTKYVKQGAAGWPSRCRCGAPASRPSRRIIQTCRSTDRSTRGSGTPPHGPRQRIGASDARVVPALSRGVDGAAGRGVAAAWHHGANAAPGS